jgi:hypothetical protein
MDEHVRQLLEGFDDALAVFDRKRPFTGPSMYFHLKTVEKRNKHDTAVDALGDDSFFHDLYATLTSWGMHRMGDTDTKLEEYESLVESFRSQREPIREIQHHTLGNLGEGDVMFVAARLWGIIENLRVGTGDTKIVAGSKALHHLLPALLPPIDRHYTVRFLFHHTTFNQGDAAAFAELFPRLARIASAKKDEIRKRLRTGGYMCTSETKIIDNAIVGFMLMQGSDSRVAGGSQSVAGGDAERIGASE